jgi:hypothetical protein
MPNLDIVTALADLACSMLVQLALAVTQAAAAELAAAAVLGQGGHFSAAFRGRNIYSNGCTDHRSIDCVSMGSSKW